MYACILKIMTLFACISRSLSRKRFHEEEVETVIIRYWTLRIFKCNHYFIIACFFEVLALM